MACGCRVRYDVGDDRRLPESVARLESNAIADTKDDALRERMVQGCAPERLGRRPVAVNARPHLHEAVERVRSRLTRSNTLDLPLRRPWPNETRTRAKDFTVIVGVAIVLVVGDMRSHAFDARSNLQSVPFALAVMAPILIHVVVVATSVVVAAELFVGQRGDFVDDVGHAVTPFGTFTLDRSRMRCSTGTS